MLSSVEFFDRLANGGLADYNQKHHLYREAIDQIVLKYAPQNPRYLDVGSGDGLRADRIKYAVDALELTLCDNSPEMAALAKKYGQVVMDSAERFCFQCDLWGKYDLITCLGTLNHVDRFYSTIDGFAKLLAPNGILVFDVMNAYNARVFGWQSALHDWICGPQLNSAFSLEGETTQMKLFVPEEIDVVYVSRHRQHPDLSLVKKCFLDVLTGARRTRWGGDMVYVFRRKPSFVGPLATEAG